MVWISPILYPTNTVVMVKNGMTLRAFTQDIHPRGC
jgi:hypothetical protein